MAKRGRKPKEEKLTKEELQKFDDKENVVVTATSEDIKPVMPVPKVAAWITVKFSDAKQYKISAATVARKLQEKGFCDNAAEIMGDPGRLIEIAGKLTWFDLRDRAIMMPHDVPDYIREWEKAEKGVIGE